MLAITCVDFLFLDIDKFQSGHFNTSQVDI